MRHLGASIIVFSGAVLIGIDMIINPMPSAWILFGIGLALVGIVGFYASGSRE